MYRITFILIASAFFAFSCQKRETADRPNIILIMCDDLGWGDTGFNGNDIIHTPNLDQLARRGVIFERFYSASAVCSPTRGSCLTGRNPYRYGIPTANAGHMRKEEITLPELLKEQGYTTGHFGKWHLGTLTTKVKDANRGRPGDSSHYSIPGMHGYDTWLVSESKVPTYDPMIKPVRFDAIQGESLRYGWKAVEENGESEKYGTYYWMGPEERETENLDGDNSRVIMDRVVPFMEDAVRNEQPFFSVIWFHTPHLPVVANKQMMEEYKDYSHREQIYYAAISGMDNQVGRLWKELERMNVDDNTMIWFCSDNGPERDTPGTAGPFRERKRSLYEGGVRVPAFCLWPGKIEGGKVTDFPMVTSDYLPTIVDFLKMEYPNERPIDGISLKNVLMGSEKEREKPIGFQFGTKMSWVTHQYKLISTDKGETYELYNLINDKEEKYNIIENNRETAEAMKKDLTEWISSCKASEKGADYPEKSEKPNILFIMTDDHACQAVSAYSNELIRTPNLDRIANEGVLFRNSFVGNSICAPSRATMLTGKHTHKNGQIDNGVTFDGSQLTFPKLLQQAGYQTALVGKWHLRSDPTGFDYWNILPGQGQYYNPDFIEMGERKRVEGYCTTVTTDFGLEWLEARDKKRPFCLLLHHKAPHRTWQPDTIHFNEFRDITFPVPSNFFDNYEGRQAAEEQHLSIRANDMDVLYDLKMEDPEGRIKSRFPKMNHTARMNQEQKKAWQKHYQPITRDFVERDLKGEELYLWKYQRYMRDYLACIRSVDENVGRVLDYLEENGLADNTLVVYTSDQGFYLGEHGWFDKRFMYEQSFRTPLMMRMPEGNARTGKIDELVQNIDYAPTFLDFAGVEIPDEIQGKSLKPLLESENKVKKWRDALYYHYYEFPNEHMVKKHYGIRTDQYKLIHFYDDIDVWELYDLKTDPEEMNNVYNNQEYAKVREKLKIRLAQLQVEYDDDSVVIPEKNNR